MCFKFALKRMQAVSFTIHELLLVLSIHWATEMDELSAERRYDL